MHKKQAKFSIKLEKKVEIKKMAQWPIIMGKRNQEAMSQMNAWINGKFWRGERSYRQMEVKKSLKF